MPILDTQAIILKSADSGETSRRLTFFSGDEGKFSLTLRGARSKRNQSLAAFEAYSVVHVYANLKPGADLGTLSKGEVVERFGQLRSDLNRLAAAGVLCEVIDRAAQPRMANERLFKYATACLRALDTEDADRIVFLIGHGLTRISQALGLAPEVESCVGCGKALGDFGEGPRWLDFEGGGWLCPPCRQTGFRPGEVLERPIAGLLRACATTPWSAVRAATDDGPEARALFTALIRWLSYHLECRLRSARFFESSLRG